LFNYSGVKINYGRKSKAGRIRGTATQAKIETIDATAGAEKEIIIPKFIILLSDFIAAL
jgi:hypothetical protein